jgi:hypothetical protein
MWAYRAENPKKWHIRTVNCPRVGADRLFWPLRGLCMPVRFWLSTRRPAGADPRYSCFEYSFKFSAPRYSCFEYSFKFSPSRYSCFGYSVQNDGRITKYSSKVFVQKVVGSVPVDCIVPPHQCLSLRLCPHSIGCIAMTFAFVVH